MQGTLRIAASDLEPGKVIVTVTTDNGGHFLIPLEGDDLHRFACEFGAAYMTAVTDMALAELNSREVAIGDDDA